MYCLNLLACIGFLNLREQLRYMVIINNTYSKLSMLLCDYIQLIYFYCYQAPPALT